MKKATCTLFIIALFMLAAVPVFAENYVGIGVHTGLHNNVGRLDSYDPDIQIEPQNNYILGFSFKTNLGFLFARFGVESTFLLKLIK